MGDGGVWSGFTCCCIFFHLSKFGLKSKDGLTTDPRWKCCSPQVLWEPDEQHHPSDKNCPHHEIPLHTDCQSRPLPIRPLLEESVAVQMDVLFYYTFMACFQKCNGANVCPSQCGKME